MTNPDEIFFLKKKINSRVFFSASDLISICLQTGNFFRFSTAGKDRTGLIVMLLYLLCDVPRELIVEDYARSESLLREARDNAELFGMDVEMTTDRIISSAKHVMEDTIEFLETRYGGVIQYLIRIGMTWEEIESLKKKLVSARPQL